MCKGLPPYRLTTANGRINQWTGNYTIESRNALVREFAQLCYLVCLMPTRSERSKGVYMTNGEKIGDERVRVRPGMLDDIELQEVKEEESEDEPAEEEPMDREEVPSPPGGEQTPMREPASTSSASGDQPPTRHADFVSDMHKSLETDYLLRHGLDPIDGPSRPYGVGVGWDVFNARMWMVVSSAHSGGTARGVFS